MTLKDIVDSKVMTELNSLRRQQEYDLGGIYSLIISHDKFTLKHFQEMNKLLGQVCRAGERHRTVIRQFGYPMTLDGLARMPQFAEDGLGTFSNGRQMPYGVSCIVDTSGGFKVSRTSTSYLIAFFGEWTSATSPRALIMMRAMDQFINGVTSKETMIHMVTDFAASRELARLAPKPPVIY